MDKHFTLAILGGGCAGLSLGLRLADAGMDAPSTLILEKNEKYTNDRTWCFWDEGNPELKECVEHSWSDFQIKNGETGFKRNCAGHPYLMVSAERFYAHAISKISSNQERIRLLNNQQILKVTKLQNQTWRIVTNNDTFTADKIVDTRPHEYAKNEDSLLWQSFLGHEVETEHELFETNNFVLMDFDTSFTDGLGFVYILPYSNKRALIEYTVFSEKSLLPMQLEGYIQLALSRNLKGINYKTLRTEYGKLPMGYKNPPSNLESNYVPAGLFAGSARPSSGYAFQRIQVWAVRCASTFINNQRLSAPQKDPMILTMMDDIFLNVLKSNPKYAVSIFYNLFLKCKPDATIRFLSDHAKLSDYLSIVLSMPKLLFLKELPFYFYKRWIKNSRE